MWSSAGAITCLTHNISYVRIWHLVSAAAWQRPTSSALSCAARARQHFSLRIRARAHMRSTPPVRFGASRSGRAWGVHTASPRPAIVAPDVWSPDIWPAEAWSLTARYVRNPPHRAHARSGAARRARYVQLANAPHAHTRALPTPARRCPVGH